MDLTLVRIRGKKRRNDYTSPLQVSSKSSAKLSKRPRTVKKDPKPAMPTLQGLPQELLESVFLYSMNAYLPRASLELGRKLSSRTMIMKFVMQSFFHTLDHETVNVQEYKFPKDPELQSELLASRFFTWKFFLAYVRKAQETFIKLRGKGWEKASVEVPGPAAFAGLTPYKFNQITYLGFAEGFQIPEKLLRGPWTDDEASLLYVLVAMGGEIDWEGTMAGEAARVGMETAIRECNERVVASLSVLLGIARAIDTRMLHVAIISCGCNVNIMRHLLFNAQILHEDTSKGLNFHDPWLWQWAETHEGKGVMLKDSLKRADKFSFDFYTESEVDWRVIVPFPYSGLRYDAKTSLNDVNRELLVRLYRSNGRRMTSNGQRRTHTLASMVV